MKELVVIASVVVVVSTIFNLIAEMEEDYFEMKELPTKKRHKEGK